MNILLFGGSGMLGSAIQAEAKNLGHEVVAPSHLECDIVTNMVESWVRPEDIVINAAGVIPGSINNFSVNALGAERVAKAAAHWKVPLIHVSTDCVFSGRRSPWHGVNDIPDPVDLYGVSKRYGEVAVQTAYPEALILRTSFIGPQHGLLRWFLDLPENSIVDGYDEATWSGSSVYEVARRILGIGSNAKFVSGIQHLAIDTPDTKYEVLCSLAKAFRPDITVKRVKEPVIHRALEPTIPMDKLESGGPRGVLAELIKRNLAFDPT